MTDPLAGTPWSSPSTVAGFVQSAPNDALLHVAARERVRHSEGAVAVDLGCGAGRNTFPIAALGWHVVGLDLSQAMLTAAQARQPHEAASAHVQLLLASMDGLPLADACADLVVAHGIWNLARSAVEFRAAVRDAARIARPGAALFVFTFSRTTLADDAEPVAGEPFVYTQFSGQPQCFLTAPELLAEMQQVGFVPHPDYAPLRELNRPVAGALLSRAAPVIYEAIFRRQD